MVSVVIPTCNRRQLVMRALHSVLAQTHDNLEVIIVDDGSSDGTAVAVSGSTDPRVTVVRQPSPVGVAAARNAGLERARGEWTAFLDDDDLWAPTKIERQLAALAADERARWACTSAVRIDARHRITGWHRLTNAEDVICRLLGVNDIPGSSSSVLTDTQLLRRLGGFRTDLGHSEDWECWIRLSNGAPGVAVDEPLVAVRAVRGTRSHVPGAEKAANERIRGLYAGLAEELRVSFDPSREIRYLARQELRAGHRLAAARRLAASGRPSLVLMASAALVAPPVWEPLWTRLRERRVVPASWRGEVRAWLGTPDSGGGEHPRHATMPPAALREA